MLVRGVGDRLGTYLAWHAFVATTGGCLPVCGCALQGRVTAGDMRARQQSEVTPASNTGSNNTSHMSPRPGKNELPRGEAECVLALAVQAGWGWHTAQHTCFLRVPPMVRVSGVLLCCGVCVCVRGVVVCAERNFPDVRQPPTRADARTDSSQEPTTNSHPGEQAPSAGWLTLC
jgi:hypothetical protein